MSAYARPPLLPLLLLLLALARPPSVSAQPSLVDIVPQQVHISLGYTPSTVVVQWVTWAPPDTATVHYGLSPSPSPSPSPSALNLTAPSSYHTFTDGDAARWNRTVHSATLGRLLPSRTYAYRISTSNSSGTYTSAVYTFDTISATAGSSGGEPIRAAMIGDWGLVNGQQTHDSLARLAKSGRMDLLIHVGRTPTSASLHLFPIPNPSPPPPPPPSPRT